MAAKKTKDTTRKPAEREEYWSAKSRLRRIEYLLWWRGWVRRGDLMNDFGVSVAQTSADLQRYHELNQGAMTYHLSHKRYEATPRMVCKMHDPRLDDAVCGFFGGDVQPGGILMGGGASADPRVDMLSTTTRGVDPQVARRVMNALLSKQWLRLRYTSLNSGKEAKRRIAPGALGWDGHRWHLRGWCEERGEWGDFVLGRMSLVDWPQDNLPADLPRDEDWETMDTVRLKINPALDKGRREAVRADNGLAGDTMELRVRRAMKPYALANHFIDAEAGGEMPRHFVLNTGRKG